MHKLSLFLLLGLLTAFPIKAATDDVNGDGRITFLLPINAPQAVAGSLGTRWQTELWVHNGTNAAITIADCGGILPCFAQSYPAGATRMTQDAPPSGAYTFSLDALTAAQATMSARLYELSRRAQPAGVYIPVVRERDFFTGSVWFVGLNGTRASRVALRVFDPFRSGQAAVHVDIVTPDGNNIANFNMTLAFTTNTFEPGYAAVYDLAAAVPQLAGVDRFDVEVTPLVPNITFWALVSVTDQETQQVLLVTPN